jgi:O-antigen/teichoic acid export membrane protein
MRRKSQDGFRLFLTNACSSVATRILQLTLFVWVNQHLVRRIEPEEYSLFPVVVSLIFFLEIFRNMVTGGIARFIVEADSRGDDGGVSRVVSSMFPIAIIAALVFGLVGAFAIWRIDELIVVKAIYVPQARIMLGLLVLTLCLNVLGAPFSEGAYARQRFVVLNVIELSSELVRIGILLFLLFGVSTQVLWLVVASTSASALSLISRIVITRRLVPAIRFRAHLFCFKTARTLLRFGGWTSIQGLTGLVASTAPTLLLNKYGTAIDVAAFYLGRLPEMQIRGLVGVASTPAMPALTRIYATQGAGALNDLYYRGGRYFLWLTLAFAAPLIVFAAPIIHLYAGPEYAPAAVVVACLFGAYPFLWASAMFYQVAHAIGKIGAYYICDIVVQLVTLAALFFTVVYHKLGAAGAGMSVGMAGAFVHIVLIWPMGLRLVGGTWRSFLRQTVAPGMAPFAIASSVCVLFANFFNVDSWLRCGLAAFASGLVYLAVLGGFCLDSLDLQILRKGAERFKLSVRSIFRLSFAA